jgi:monofunctional biosynthetic peptidoglycan transglycosylase|nr:monofunctional biosynthetic peptidoglycan transglycosylase [Panacagrimonas sp.]
MRSSGGPSTRTRRRLPRLAMWLLLGVLGVTVVPVLLLAVVPVWTSSFMIGYQIDRLTSDKPLPALAHDWASWDQIAPAAKLAVIAAEDQRFSEHFGFDLEAIEKAVKHNRNHRRKRGASTISQQVAKNLFLWSGRSWTRKAFEVGYTVLIEALWSKQRVLEVYLNIAEFGPGVYGVEAASQKYFRKPASKLTYPEAALLAAVLPNPKRLRVATPSTYVQQRAGWILGQMYQLGPAAIEQL